MTSVGLMLLVKASHSIIGVQLADTGKIQTNIPFGQGVVLSLVTNGSTEMRPVHMNQAYYPAKRT